MKPPRHGSRLRRTTAGLALVATAASFGLAGAPAAHAEERPPFYEPPVELPTTNGELIRSEPSTYYLDPLKAIKVDADVHRLMYRTTDGNGEGIAVTGTVITPRKAWKGDGERPLISYAAGTQGIGDHCAPSRQLSNGTEYEGIFIKGLIARGYAVVMTDYEGLGTPGDHTYINREVSGNAVLDVVRAAQSLPEANLPANGPVAITGYSQGGGAAAAAAELAPEYAPELDIKGAAVGAVPSELSTVAENLDRGLYSAFLGYAIVGLAAGHDIDTDEYLNDKGRDYLTKVKQACTIEAVATLGLRDSRKLTANGEPITEYLKEPQWKAIVDEQKIGERKPEVPVLINHSRLDDVIPFKLGKELKADWCAKGATVEFKPNLGPTHIGGAIASFPRTFLWLEGVLKDKPAPSNC
ncbi:lipase family protein [Streptomyces tardus]|uniref:lipase family protein n=1 Tax=Streptomyces tardus TaxID=2780544 RepID=UPI0027E3D76B|nr:lipase family protein [Streptomyces tardus]